jgi:uncharacterized protein
MKLLFSFAIFFAAWSASPRDLNKEYKKIKATIAGKTIQVYLAENDLQRQQGLMFIRQLEKDLGMMFVFDQEQPLSFWMKNTVIPLSIGFFNKDGVLVDVQEMPVAASIMDQQPPSYTSKKSAMYALEMNKNWFASNKIKPGAKIILEKRLRP